MKIPILVLAVLFAVPALAAVAPDAAACTGSSCRALACAGNDDWNTAVCVNDPLSCDSIIRWC